MRKILGAVRVNNEWRIRYNKEVMQIYKELVIVTYIKIARLKWIGYVNRMGKQKSTSPGFCQPT